MPPELSQKFPLQLWLPCYPEPSMTMRLKSDGLHIVTLAPRTSYALRYPLLKAKVAVKVVCKILYRLTSGELAFGALNADESRWLATSTPGEIKDGRDVKTFRLKLEAQEKFVLMVTNAHPDGDIASSFVVESIDISGAEDGSISFGSRDHDESHHYIISQFPCPNIFAPAKCSAFFIGAVFRDFLFTGQEGFNPARLVSTSYPSFNDEYFEWVALLSAARAARDRFTMIELGAGYGRWSMMGAAAARRLGLPFHLTSVEAEPTHFRWMEMCYRDNAIDPAEHNLVEAAVAGTPGDVWFHIGQASDWYGQHIVLGSEMPGKDPGQIRVEGDRSFRKVRAITLDSLLEPLAEVDLIDIDIQGAEAEVLAASRDQLNAKVKMVFVGTHLHPHTYSMEIHDAVTKIFTEMSWVNIFHFAPSKPNDTPYGSILFDDGVQVWVNPKAMRTLEIIRHS